MFISNLKELRGIRDITQAAIGLAAGTGQTRVFNFERYGATPRKPQDTAALVRAYGDLCGMKITLDQLLQLQQGKAVELAAIEAIEVSEPAGAGVP